MRRATRYRARYLAALLLAGAALVSCTLEIDVPIEPPPESWDPALNTHPEGPAFQQLLNRYVRDGLPGVVLFVRTPEGQWNGAAGYAKIETADRMQPTHRHFAASMTKMYTATAVLLLAEDGLIDLDARIGTYLPASVYDGVANAASSTVRQLLGHTSGIPDFSGDLKYDLDTLNDPMGWYPADRLLSYVKGQDALFAPGTGYFYSNTNYLLLAMLVDRVTGASHADVISDCILRPLGLDATYYKNEPGYPTPAGLVNSYQDIAGDGRLMNVSDMTIHYNGMYFGHTGLIATSADFADFIEGLLGGSVLGDSMLTEMLERTEHSCYGLGLHFSETDYGLGIGHGGGDFGIRSEARHFPEFGATIVLLVNGGEDGITGKLFKHLWDEAMRTALGDL